MATISIYAGKTGLMPGMIKDTKTAVKNLKNEFATLKGKVLSVSSSICDLNDVIQSISASVRTQEDKAEALESLREKSEEFIEDTVRIDEDVADKVNQNKDDFYDKYSYLKPDCEKTKWEKFCEGCKKVAEWCKENWKSIAKIVAAVVIIVALGIASVLTGGTLAIILAGAFWGALAGGLISGLMGGIMSAMNGGSFLEGFADGLLSGAISGAITGAAFAGLGLAGQALGKMVSCASKLGKAIKVVSKVSAVLSFCMDGFDTLAFGLSFFDPNNPLVKLNQKLHESTLYNVAQVGINALAIFTAGMTSTMKCFVAGTLVMTAAGLVAIECIRAGDRVISTDPDTMERAEKTVLETYVRETNEVVHLTINGEVITSTLDHPFYVQDAGFVSAGDLYIGDKLLDAEGNTLLVEDMKAEKLSEPVKVYNFQVEEFHTYHITKSSVLVHNADDYNTGWSDEITRYITSPEEAEIYKNAGLREVEIDGKKALIRDDIDFSSPENIARLNPPDGKPPKSPVNKNGEVIELHHIGQNPDSPLAELTFDQHQGGGNKKILHDTSADYETKIDRKVFARERRAHWEARRAASLNG